MSDNDKMRGNDLMRIFVYPARFAPAKEGGFVVTFRDLPEAITQGEDMADARLQAADCLDEAIAGRIDDDEDIPPPSVARKGEQLIAVPTRTAAQGALHLAMRAAGISKSELARRLGCDEREARRLLDPHHPSKIERLESALAAVGGEVALSYRKIA